MKTTFYLTLAAVSLAFAGNVSAATLINGSFELGTNPGSSFSTQAAGSTAITGWTVGGFGVDYIGGFWQASDGVRSLDLSALSAGSVSQTFATVTGFNYLVTFDLSGNPDGAPAMKTAVVSIAGSLPSIKTYTVGPSNSHSNMNWQNYTYAFTAFSTSSTLVFASADYTPFGPALDNVAIIGNDGIGSAVPEPATWALLAVGFGLIGARSRRRSHAVAA